MNVRELYITVFSWLFIIPVGSFFSVEQPKSREVYANDSLLFVTGNLDDHLAEAKITVNGFEILADVAITNEEQTKGLSIKEHMNEDEGMLFVYDRPLRQGFWMKDMKFPIDIIWLNGTGSIVHIEENLQPCISSLECPSFSPDEDAQYVLETVAGFSRKHQLEKGTEVDFSLISPNMS